MLNDVELDPNIVESSIDFHFDLLLLAPVECKTFFKPNGVSHENFPNQYLGAYTTTTKTTIYKMIEHRFCLPDASVLLSTSAFKLLVGAMRCGNLGDPFTRSLIVV